MSTYTIVAGVVAFISGFQFSFRPSCYYWSGLKFWSLVGERISIRWLMIGFFVVIILGICFLYDGVQRRRLSDDVAMSHPASKDSPVDYGWTPNRVARTLPHHEESDLYFSPSPLWGKYGQSIAWGLVGGLVLPFAWFGLVRVLNFLAIGFDTARAPYHVCSILVQAEAPKWLQWLTRLGGGVDLLKRNLASEGSLVPTWHRSVARWLLDCGHVTMDELHFLGKSGYALWLEKLFCANPSKLATALNRASLRELLVLFLWATRRSTLHCSGEERVRLNAPALTDCAWHVLRGDSNHKLRMAAMCVLWYYGDHDARSYIRANVGSLLTVYATSSQVFFDRDGFWDLFDAKLMYELDNSACQVPECFDYLKELVGELLCEMVRSYPDLMTTYCDYFRCYAQAVKLVDDLLLRFGQGRGLARAIALRLMCEGRRDAISSN